MNKRLGVMFLVLAYFLLIGSTYFFSKPIGKIILDDTDITNDNVDDVIDIKKCPDFSEYLDEDYYLEIYVDNDDYTYSSYYLDDNGCKKNNDFGFKIKTESKNPNGIAISKNNRYILYEDNGNWLYDKVKNKNFLTDLISTDDELYFVESSTGYGVSGVGSLNGFYSLELNKVIYKDKGYNYFGYETEELISAYSEDDNDEYSFLLKTNDEEILVYNDSPCGYHASEVYGKYIAVQIGQCDGGSPLYEFYNKEYVKLIDTWFSYTHYNFMNDYLYIIRDNALYKYDEKGNYELLSDSENYLQIFEDNSLVYIKDGYLHYENKSVGIDEDIIKWKEEYMYDNCISYLNKDSVDLVVVSNPFASEEKDSDTLNISINLKTGVIKTRIDVGNVPGHCGC